MLQSTLWVVGGTGAEVYNDAWSFDGQTWRKSTASSFTPRAEFSLTAFQERLLLIGGVSGATVKNDVWSFNGASWTELTPAPFTPRQLHCATPLNNNGLLYVFGGWNSVDAVEYNEVWSFDGASTWTALPSPEWQPRFGASALQFNGSIFMLGGANSQGRAWNDAWRFDGAVWESLLSAAFVPRCMHATLAWQGDLLVVGGRSASGEPLADVWRYASSWGQGTLGSWGARSAAVVLPNPFPEGESTPPGQSVILLGGGGAPGTEFNDVWVLRNIDPPSPPLHCRASAIQAPLASSPSNSVLVTWDAPLSVGGAPILGYIVRNDFDNAVVFTNRTVPPLQALVPSLTFPANYSFFVVAKNMAGESVGSELSASVRTAAPGEYVNNGGPLPPSSADSGGGVGGEGDKPVGRQGITTRVWFIVLIVLLSVGTFVAGCFFIVRRHLKSAREDLARLEEIEAMDAEEELHHVAIQDSAGGAGSPDGEGMDGEEKSLAAGSSATLDILRGIGRRTRAAEMEKWRRGQYVSSSAALKGGSTSSASNSSAPAIDQALVMPLGFQVGGEEEEEAIERLGKELQRLNALGDPSAHSGAPSSDHVYELCSTLAEQLCTGLADEYDQRLQSALHADPDSLHTSAERMAPYEEILVVLSHAVQGSGIVQFIAGGSAVERAQREELLGDLFSALVEEVSTAALEKQALRSALAGGGKSKSAKSASGGGGEEQGDAASQHLFLVARACMLRWLFERVKRSQREQLALNADQLRANRRSSGGRLNLSPNILRQSSQDNFHTVI